MNINTATQYDVFRYWEQNSDPYTKGIPIGFFTTPAMNFTETNSNMDSYFAFIKETYPDLYSSLSCMGGSGCSTSSPFIKLLHNHMIGLSGGKDASMKTIDVGETYYGYKQTLPGPIIDSIVGDTFSVKFKNEKNLWVIHMIKLWMEYIENVTRGMFIPFEDMVTYGEIDYVSSFYYFVLDYDLSTILYFSRYTGVAPILNPYSALVSTGPKDNDITEIEVEFAYSYKEDLNPEILIDFNKLSQNEYTKLRGNTNTSASFTIPAYNHDMDGDFDSIKTGNPVICRKTITNAAGLEPKIRYKLFYQ